VYVCNFLGSRFVKYTKVLKLIITTARKKKKKEEKKLPNQEMKTRYLLFCINFNVHQAFFKSSTNK